MVSTSDLVSSKSFISRPQTNSVVPTPSTPIVSNNGINQRSGVVQVVYLTSPNKQRRTNTINPTVHVNSRESIAVCNQVTNVDKSRLTRRIGHVEDHELETIQDGITVALGLD
nr:MAG TPA: PemK-like protein [Caudoviricetes sp.]